VSVKRLLCSGVIALATLTLGETRGTAVERLQLQVTPAVSMAPASVLVRAIIERDATNRQLEIVADSESFYRRTVVDLDGEQAPKVNELRMVDVPGGEYEITATLYDEHGERINARRSIMVMSLSERP
jgi:hypothetical protein